MRILTLILLMLTSYSTVGSPLLLTAEVTSRDATMITMPYQRGMPFSKKITWMAPEGSVVEAGAPVVLIDSQTLATSVDQNEESLENLRDSHATQTSSEQVAIESAQRRIFIAELELEKAQLQVDATTSYTSKKDIADAVFAVSAAQSELDKAKDSYEFTQSKSQASFNARIRSIRAAELGLESVLEQIEKGTIKAKDDSVVVYESSTFGDRKVAAGDSVQVGSPLIQLIPIDGASLRAMVSEVDTGRLAVNDKVSIYFDSDARISYRGRISEVAQAGQMIEGRGVGRWMTVDIELLTRPDQVTSGMGARVEVNHEAN